MGIVVGDNLTATVFHVDGVGRARWILWQIAGQVLRAAGDSNDGRFVGGTLFNPMSGVHEGRYEVASLFAAGRLGTNVMAR